MSNQTAVVKNTSLGQVWFRALVGRISSNGDAQEGTVWTGVTTIGGQGADVVAIVPDENSRFLRARNGEVGLAEGLGLFSWLDKNSDINRPLIVVVDVPSQAYGYAEELFGINYALAASVTALAQQRLSGRKIVSLIVGNAISGAFLATGLQSQRMVMLDHDRVQIQVMSKKAAARITQRTVEQLDTVAEQFPAMSFKGQDFVQLGAIDSLIPVADPENPNSSELDSVVKALEQELDGISENDVTHRLLTQQGVSFRSLSVEVRQVVNKEW